MRKVSILIFSGALAAYGQVLKTTDISPDGKTFAFTGQLGSGGRIMSLVIDPNHDDTVYAAGEFAGVWKSTNAYRSQSDYTGRSLDTRMEWSQSSIGLRNGLTQNQYSLAVDGTNSKHLLYATGDNDGRPTTKAGAHPHGGLWVSLDAADHWHHEKLCSTAFDDGVSSVVFSTGRAFVVTACGIWVNKSGNLDSSSWSLLTGLPSGLGAGAFLVDGGDKTLYACSGNQVFYTPDLGMTWNQTTVNGNCRALAAVSDRANTPGFHDVLVVHGSSQEVTDVAFGVSPPLKSGLGFSSVASNGGSGTSAIATVFIRKPTGPSFESGPGLTYDLYVADALNWYEYAASAPHWIKVPIHVDTWAMAFPSWYDPAKGRCAAYAANDGGIFFNAGNPGSDCLDGGCASGTWIPVQDGLHALEATQVGAITAGSLPFAGANGFLVLYLPTGDNDMFLRVQAICSGKNQSSCAFYSTTGSAWLNPGDGLGDAGQALVDPAFPDQVLFSRNAIYKILSNPPAEGGTYTELIPSGETFDNGGQSVGTYNLTAVMTTPGELSNPRSHGDYIAVRDFDPWNAQAQSGCSATKLDHVVRNTSDVASGWVDLSPGDHFLSCDIKKVQAGGGHSGGMVVYVLTTQNSYAHFDKGRGPGKIYRGDVSIQDSRPTILTWKEASGSKDKPLGQADNFYVNPFDPSELYAVDVTNQKVMVSRDSGGTWDQESSLIDLATNHGEYVIGCNGSRGGEGAPSDPFANVCTIAWIAFDVFHPKIRVVGAAYGGIVFSRDNGHHWMALDVTHNNHLVSDNLTEIVGGVFFDGETSFPGVAASDQVIYAGLKGRSLIRVEGPFLTMEALNFEYKPPTGSVVTSVSVSVSTQSTQIPLRKDPDGFYRGTLLFDSAIYTNVDYKLFVDGFYTSTGSHTFTAADLDNGAVTVRL